MQHFIPTVLTLMLCLASLSVQAQTYYVSSSSGNDSNSGLSAAQAWKSVSKVNTEMRNIAAGAAIRFKRGETFIGQLNVTVDNLTVGAYDAGDAPLIRATRWMGTNWTSRGGNIWEVSLPTTPERVRAVYRGRNSLPLGRHPNLSDPVHKGYYYYESITQVGGNQGKPTSITDNNLTGLSSEDWTGREFVVRFNRWRLVVDTVASQSGGRLTLKNIPNLGLPKKKDFGYFFQNHIKTLDEQDEWAYDRAAGKIYLYSTTDPNTQPYSYASEDYAIQLDGANGVRVANLALMGSNQAALGINESNNATVDNITVDPSGFFGIHVVGSSGASILNCQISHTNLEGIRVERNSTGARIANNTLEDIAMVAGMGQSDGDGYSGMYILGTDGVIENNTIQRTGYCGIRIDMYSGLVRRNLIEEVCFVKDDGGGIYINDNNATTTNKPIIEENIIRKTVGNGAANGSDRPDGIEVAEGIYTDVNSYGSTIRYNTVSEAHHGLYVNDSPDHLIYGNTVNGTYRYSIKLKQDQDPEAESYRNLQVYDNILVEIDDERVLNEQSIALENNVVPFASGDNAKDMEGFGRFTNNYIVNPVKGQEAEAVNLVFKHDGSVYETNPCCSQAFVSFTAPAIDAFLNSFNNTQVLPLVAPNPEPANFKLFYENPSNQTVSRSLPGTYVDAKGNTYSGSISIAPWRSVVLFRSEYVESVTFPDPGKWYYLVNRACSSSGSSKRLYSANGRDVTLSLNGTGSKHQWRFQDSGNGNYFVINRASGNRLDVDDCATVDLNTGGTNANKQWQLRSANAQNTYYYLDGQGCANRRLSNNGCNEVDVKSTQSTQQQWQLLEAGSYNARSSTLAEKEAVEEKFVEELRIYPIPAHDVLQLRSGKGAFTQLRLTDLSGKELGARIQYAPGGASLSVGSLSQGVYLLHGNVGKRPFVNRIMVEKK
jgi:parallel beta-helix repeat protein